MRLALLLLAGTAAFAQPGFISTYAGAYPDGLGGPARQAALVLPGHVAIDKTGSLYITAQNLIYKITPDRRISIFAGTGVSGLAGDGVPARFSQINTLWGNGIVADSGGNVLFVEAGFRIRKISPDGVMRTFAGTGGGGSSSDGVPALQAQITPRALALDLQGNLYLSDRTRVRKVTSDGKIITVAGNGIPGYSGDGGPALQASLSEIWGIAVDSNGNLFVADFGVGVIRKVAVDGTISTVVKRNLPGSPQTALLGTDVQGLAIDRNDNVYFSSATRAWKLDQSGLVTVVAGGGRNSGEYEGPALNASFPTKHGMAFDPAGNLMMVSSADLNVTMLDGAGNLSILAGVIPQAGAAGPLVFARLTQPQDVAFDRNGVLLAVETGGIAAMRRLTPGQVATTDSGFPYINGLATDALGNAFAVSGDGQVFRIDSANNRTVLAGRATAPGDGTYGGDGGPALQALFKNPQGLAVDSAGSVYVADRDNQRVRKITSDGIVNTVAGNGIAGFAGDGGPATGARLNNPTGIAVEAQGNLFIADSANNRIRKVGPDGNISTFAGNGESGFSGDGGPAIRAQLGGPGRLASDAAGNLYVTSGNRVRKITRDGIISTIAGNGSVGSGGDGGPAVDASFNGLGGMAVDLNGNVYVADQGNNRIRKIQGSAPFSVTPGSFVFATTLGARASSQPLNLATSDGAARKFQITANVPWLNAAPSTGTVTSAADARVIVTADPAGLKKGTYPAALTILDVDAGAAVQVPVTLTVSGTAQQLRLSQVGATFTVIQGAGDAPSQNIQVVNIGTGAMPWTTTSSTLSGGASWLVVTRGSGTTTAGSTAPAFTVTTVAAGLAPGSYYGRIDVAAPSADNSPQSAVVLLNVLPSDGSPGPQVNPAGLLSTSDPAATPPAQQVELANLSARTINYTASVRFTNGTGWLTVPGGGSLAAGQRRNIDISPSATSLTAGVYRATITFNFTPDNVTRTLDVALVVNAPPSTGNARGNQAACAAKVLVAVIKRPGSSYQTAAGWPVPVEASIIDDCRTPLTQGTAIVAFSNIDPPLALLPTGDGNWQATWASRTTQASVTLTLRASTLDQTLTGQTTVAIRSDLNPNQPSIAPGGVLNAASFRGETPVSPGEYVSIFGARLAKEFQSASSLPLPSTLGDTVIAVGGKAAPLHFASDGQVNAILPYGIPDSTTLQMIVRRGNVVSLPEPVLIATTQPAVFAYDGSGKGQGHIYGAGADGVLRLADNANPVKAGDAVVFYATGLGPVNPPVVEGQAAPSDPISLPVNPIEVTIQGKKSRVVFAGLAPGFAGVFQVNVYVPEGVTADPAAPLVISAGGQPGPVVTLAITQ